MNSVLPTVTFLANCPAEFAVNKLTQQNIGIKGLVQKDGCVEFSVPKWQANEAKYILEKASINVQIIGENGALYNILQGIKRVGLLLGGLIGIVLIFCYSSLVFGVEISGNNQVSDMEIIRKINEDGVAFPMIKSKIDLDKITTIVEDIEEVSDASIKFEGTQLIIDIVEMFPEDKLEGSQNLGDIISLYDGRIVSIFATSGTPLVNPGDKVNMGDVLIAGYRMNSIGEKEPSSAGGKVTMDVVLSESNLYPDTQIIKVRTGRCEEKTTLYSGSLRYEKSSSFALYDSESKIHNISAIVPLQICKTIYYELEEKEAPFDFNALQDLLVEEGYENLRATLPADSQVLDRGFYIKKLDKMTELSIYYNIRIVLGN